MAITSNAFGRVTLTDCDAETFKRQVTYGKPKKAAYKSVSDGRVLAAELEQNGFVTMSISKRDRG